MSEDAIQKIIDDNKSTPRLRVDGLNENSTRYDRLVAAPSDERLVMYWFSWGSLALLVGLFSLSVLLGILSSRKVRRKPFNLYLLYLLIPDFFFSIFCGITCLLNALNGAYWSKWMCNFQQFYVVFGIGANAWLNAVVAYQLHKMLRNSHNRRRYKLPSKRQVTMQALAVYAWCSFLGSWGIYEAPQDFPFHSGLVAGLACVPLEVDSASSVFFWVVFFPCFCGIPIVYVSWVTWDVYHRKLLPPSGKRRLLMIYFGRIVLIFLVMWIPTLLLIFVLSSWLPPWVPFAGGTWSHFQTFVSAVCILLKPDILEAVKMFVTCQWYRKEREEAKRLADVRRIDLPSSNSNDSCFRNSFIGLQSSFFFGREKNTKESVIGLSEMRDSGSDMGVEAKDDDGVSTSLGELTLECSRNESEKEPQLLEETLDA
jgi:hypothetical protein